jgi:hypothetical protein
MVTWAVPTWPQVLDVLTMAPPPVLSMAAVSCFIALSTPQTLMSKTARYFSSVISDLHFPQFPAF